MSAVPLVVHVGYPKTATTTFQARVFPHHPEIDYLGKFIPSFRYREEETYFQIDDLLHRNELYPLDIDPLRKYVNDVRLQSCRKVVLISSESFIHPSVIDVATVARRLKDVFGDIQVLITIREQIGALLSFYWMHGRYGEYLSIGARDISKPLVFPLSFSEWIAIQMHAFDKSYLATLKYYDVISLYTKLFGRENVQVLMFETFSQFPEIYAQQLGEVLNVDESIVKKLMEAGHENPSEARMTPWSQQDVGNLQTRWGEFLSLFLKKKNNGFSVSDKETLASLQELYRPGNRRLLEEYDVSIDAMGYVV